ncbi:Pr6Pr family membrane protein [Dokdonella sp. MW10]|uniref:Pr6Pr family membrane protein n=1 Tax=Dokdonella sp. MW10 TaxID=2992926 RepID=UPI003F7DF711
MSARGDHLRRVAAALVAATAAFALGLQYGLLVAAKRETSGVALATLEFLSYFTILSNLMVAVVTTAAVADRPARLLGEGVRGAVAVYIGVTGLIYVTVLAALWQPTGWQHVADTLLHAVVPLAYLAWWACSRPRGGLRLAHVAWWLAWPAAYLALVLARGAWLGAYPYPFIDVGVLGANRAFVNALAVAGVFLVVGLIVLGADRLRARAGG